MILSPRALFVLSASVLALAACSKPAPASRDVKSAVVQAPPAPAATPPTLAAASIAPQAQAINAATWPADGSDAATRQRALVRVQVLLDRAHRSPGVIDGRDGTNLTLAIESFQAIRGLTVDGQLNPATFEALVAADGGPVLTDYQITGEDVAGPFTPDLSGDDYEALAKLPALGFATPLEALAEKFHMDEALLQALNPGVDFTKAGTMIVVAATGPKTLDAKVARIEVDKTKGQVRAFDDQDALLAVYPATVGSTERPAPVGTWAVNTVAPRPTYTYDPSRLTFGEVKGKLTLAAGPNNPVGSTWIDLTKDTYGIHGTPDPKLINKRASHGCVRLTNWDAAQLGAAVQKGAKVVFLGAAST